MAILKIKNARIAFPQLFKAVAFQGEGDPVFSANFIISKDHPQMAEITKLIEEVSKLQWKDKSSVILKNLYDTDKVCIHKGDLKPEYGGYPGNLFISARNKIQPRVVDRDGLTVLTTADGRPYAGCYVNASFEVYAQDNNYGKRIVAKLRGVQFVKDGEAFSGGAPAGEDEFDSVGEDDLEDLMS